MLKLILPLTFIGALAAAPAYAQSTEEVIGAAIGGAAGAYAGGELDNKGSKTEGQIIGAIAGGVAGYAIGDAIDNDRRYSRRNDEIVYVDGKPSRRYYDDRGDEISIYVDDDDRYFSGKEHPVFNEHPGRGHGVNKVKHKKHKKYKNKR